MFDNTFISQMIAANPYKCSSNPPNEAKLVCFTKDCKEYALVCGTTGCSCMTPHLEHSLMLIDGVFKKVEQQPVLNEEHSKMEATIDSMLDTIIKELEQLKASHKQHVQAHLEKWAATDILKRKLSKKESLETA